MDFLRLHLPGLHQALRGALDSFNAFVSYLIGDDVPTVEQEAQAAKELREVAAEKPEKTRQEEAQEALEGLRDSQSQGFGKPGGSGEAGRCLKGSSSAEQTWGWGKGSSHRSQADGQDTGTWEAAKAFRDQDPGAPMEARKKSEAGSRVQQDRSSQSQERQEPNEQEVNRGEMLRTWEQEEEDEEEEEKEEEVRATEPGVARGVESEWTWHKETEVKAGADGQKVAGDSREIEQVVSEAVAETEGSGTRGPGREEEGLVVVRSGQSIRAQETQGTGVESDDWATLGREEARITSSGREEVWTDLAREKADLPGDRETEYGPVSGERIPEATGKVCALDKATEEVQEEEVKGETEVKLCPKHLGTEEIEEAAEGQTAGREAAEGQESEEEAGQGFEGEISQYGKEARGRQDLQIRADGVGLEEDVHAEEGWEEEGSCLATEAELALDKEAQGGADLEAVPEARPDEEFVEERSKEAQRNQKVLEKEWDDLKHKVTEGQEPELMGGVLTPTEQPEEGQEVWKELGRVSDLRREEMERGLEEHYRHMGSVDPEVPAGKAWGNKRRDRGSRNTQEEKVDAEDGEEEATGGQALEAKAKGGWESELPEIQGCVTEEGEAFVAENQELQGSPGEEAGIGQSPGESEARETEDSKEEGSVPWEADLISRGGWRLQEAALGLQDHEDTQTSSLAPEVVQNEAVLVVRAAGAEEGPEWEAGADWVGEYGRGWDLIGREEAEGEAELVGAAEGENRGGQDFDLEDLAEEEVTGRGGEGETLEAREGELAEVEESAVAEEDGGMEDVTSGSQAARAEGAVAIAEEEGLLGEQPLLEEEAGGWEAREQRKDSEGQCGDHLSEGEAQRQLGVEDIGTGGQRSEAKETDPEGLEDVQYQEGQLTQQALVEALPGPSETAEGAGSARENTQSSWCEALLPGSRLDVSVPRSRALLSRSSSQRRSRPSFRRTRAPEQPEDPPSPQPKEGLSDPEQRPLQLEETPEPIPPRPEGTPVPARRKPLGHGFGLAHPGMMQELQARLGRPKPQ